LRGRGTGTFLPRTDFATGKSPYSLLTADFNNDGIPDVAVTNLDALSVSVLLGKGDGTFQSHKDATVGREPRGIAVADFNADGKPDLAVANFLDDNISILLGNGDGTFQPHFEFAAGVHPWAIAVGDLNNDGIADLAVADSKNVGKGVMVLVGIGNGTFRKGVGYGGHGSYGVTIGDLNADGNQDIVLASVSAWGVTVMFGKGDGTFAPPVTIQKNSLGTGILIADLNGDGKIDLAVTGNDAGAVNNVSVFLGDGSGKFPTLDAYDTGNAPVTVIMGDFNHDGRPDLATPNEQAGSVSILLNTGK
jgi:hypothetical protein